MHAQVDDRIFLHLYRFLLLFSASSCATYMRQSCAQVSLNDQNVLWFKNAPRETRWRNRNTHSQHEEFLSILRILCGFFSAASLCDHRRRVNDKHRDGSVCALYLIDGIRSTSSKANSKRKKNEFRRYVERIGMPFLLLANFTCVRFMFQHTHTHTRSHIANTSSSSYRCRVVDDGDGHSSRRIITHARNKRNIFTAAK